MADVSGTQAPALVTGAFAAWLEASRYDLNQRIAEAARSSSTFQPAVLGDALRDLVAPVVDAVDARGEGFATLVSASMFDIALGLCAEGRLVGAVREGWRRLLPVVTTQLATDPHRVVASLTNALANLERTSGARPDPWIDAMVQAAPLCASADDLLVAGQVASWRCGMAHYRRDALALAAALDGPLVTALLPKPVAELAASPWAGADPSDLHVPTGARPVRVGGFRGFGGAFARPPIVGLDGDVVVAFDGDEPWLVFADAFGATVVRGPITAEMEPTPSGPVPAVVAAIPELTSWADTPAGLVATSSLAHAVLFLGPST